MLEHTAPRRKARVVMVASVTLQLSRPSVHGDPHPDVACLAGAHRAEKEGESRNGGQRHPAVVRTKKNSKALQVGACQEERSFPEDRGVTALLP
jgi:hypothetical protein